MEDMQITLGDAVQIGAYTLTNRVVMAPLTRMRANKELALTDLHATYYKQRSTAGLIVTEASQISPQGMGYPQTPGIYNQAQIEGWKKVTDAVHEGEAKIFIQLWHVGRISHSSLRSDHSLPVGPSALAATGNAFTVDFGRVPFEVAHALTHDEIKAIVADYKQAAQNALAAGFDGVELHAANGYLLEQFMRSVSNQRTDHYGGSVENRSRLLFEVLEAILEVWPSNKVGIRISPYFTGSMDLEPDTFGLYDYVISHLNKYKLAYLHLIETKGSTGDFDQHKPLIDDLLAARYRAIYTGTIIVAGGFDQQRANDTLAKGYADAVAFGRAFISTPDLTYRLMHGLAPNPIDPTTISGGDAKGYTDYPSIANS